MAEGDIPVEILEQVVRDEPTLALSEEARNKAIELYTEGRLGVKDSPLAVFKARSWFNMSAVCVICSEVNLEELDVGQLEGMAMPLPELADAQAREDHLKDVIAQMLDDMIVDRLVEIGREPAVIMHQGRDVSLELLNGIVEDQAS